MGEWDGRCLCEYGTPFIEFSEQICKHKHNNLSLELKPPPTTLFLSASRIKPNKRHPFAALRNLFIVLSRNLYILGVAPLNFQDFFVVWESSLSFLPLGVSK